MEDYIGFEEFNRRLDSLEIDYVELYESIIRIAEEGNGEQ